MIDPLTGLPADALASDAFQIPLDSNPALAPEWSPKGSPPFALFPDNIVPTFATLQAQNSKDKKNVQAATTDGLGNLNVNIAGGGGGGGGAVVPLKQVQYTNFSGFGDIAVPMGLCSILYAAIGYVHSWRSNTRKTQVLFAGIRDEVSGDRFDFVETTADYSAMDFPPTDIMYPISLVFPAGLDLRTLMRTSNTMSLIFDGGTSFWGGVFCNVAYS